MNTFCDYNINPLVQAIGKEPAAFTKKDLTDYIVKHEVRIVNFRYVAADGRLKTLNFPVTNRQYLDTILSYGERVDGSSLFPYIAADSSDLYVIPRFSTAYVDPFQEIPTVGFLYSYFTKDGLPLESAPEFTLRKAHKAFRERTGYTFEAMGELEFYLVDSDDGMFPAEDQHGYHESTPFAKFESFRADAIRAIAEVGGQIKYGHCEVGNFTLDGKIYEQNEIEFLVNPVESAADQLMMAKWILRSLAYQYGIDVTFAPKITTGKAGSGLHFHTRMMKGDRSVMIKDGSLSDDARRAIAGYMKFASSLTAFGNTNPTSYFRLVPHQEAPTNVCWGDCNRSALVRVPLGFPGKQTFEMRSPDCSADIYQLMAGRCVAARIGLEMPREEALKLADETYVDMDIHKKENAARLATLQQLPTCCTENADCLEAVRTVYEQADVFRPRMIDGILKALRSYGDADLHREARGDTKLMRKLVTQYFYCG